MCEHRECEHSLGPSSHCSECDRLEELKHFRHFAPIRDNENKIPQDLEEYKTRIRDLAYRLKDDQFITVRVDLLRDLLFTE